MAHKQFFLGIDGGGTKTKARLETANGEVIGEGLAGLGNPAQNAEVALDSMIKASTSAMKAAGLSASDFSHVSACLGLAGVNIPKYYDIATQWALPFRQTLITTDLHIACTGAHAGEEGAILITGTGCSAFVSVDNQQTTLGGHGFPIGDKSSGAWLGLRALSLTLESLDELREKTSLSVEVCRALACNSSTELVAKTLHFKATQFAELAPLVIKRAASNDMMAEEILLEGQRYLVALTEKLLSLKPARFSMIGGLAPHWAELLPINIQRHLSPSLCTPEYGAVALAKQTFKDA